MLQPSIAFPRATLALALAIALCGQSASAGFLTLGNALPIPVWCSLEIEIDPPVELADAIPLQQVGKMTLLQDKELSSRDLAVAIPDDGFWPAEIRYDAGGEAYIASSWFAELTLTCRVGPAGAPGLQRTVRFTRDVPRPMAAGGAMPQLGGRAPDGTHVLRFYTPSDRTAFLMRLEAKDLAATPADLRAGAPLVVDVRAAPAGERVKIFPEQPQIELGRYELLALPVNAPAGDAPVVDAPMVEVPLIEAPLIEAPLIEAPVGGLPSGAASELGELDIDALLAGASHVEPHGAWVEEGSAEASRWFAEKMTKLLSPASQR